MIVIRLTEMTCYSVSLFRQNRVRTATLVAGGGSHGGSGQGPKWVALSEAKLLIVVAQPGDRRSGGMMAESDGDIIGQTPK